MPSISVPLAAGLTSLGVGAATAGTIAAVAAPALTYAAAGAALGGTTAALTGGKVGKGALMGAEIGGTYGLGSGGYSALQGAFPETMGSITGALGLGGVGSSAAGPLSGDSYSPAMAQMTGLPDVGITPQTVGSNPGGYLGTLGQMGDAVPGNPVASNASKGLLGLSNTDLLLGALGALGSSTKPAAPNYGAMPGPGSTAATRGPLWNQPLGTGYINRQQTQPQMSNNDYYSYGVNGGHAPFFSGNQLSFAHGGTIDAMGGDDEDGYVEGAGDGQSDDIPARLSDGEFVVNADVVSALGNGSNRKGAQKLDEMRRAVMRDRGTPKVVPKKIKKHPMQYLKEAS